VFIDKNVTVVGDRLVTVNISGDIELRLVHTGQMVHTIRTGNHDSTDPMHWTQTMCITSVPDHSELIVTGHKNGDVQLWDIEKGGRARECV
jgi:WD40 repeat protein